MELHLTATECRLPNGITLHTVLPATRHKYTCDIFFLNGYAVYDNLGEIYLLRANGLKE